MRQCLLAIFFMAAWQIPAFAQPRLEFTSTTVWAARTAAADLQQLPPDLASRSRYVWLRGGTQAELAALSFVVNSTLSRVNVGLLPSHSPGIVPFAGGKLVRLDLAAMATEPTELAHLVATWEKLAAVDRDFTATLIEKQTELVKVAPYKHTDGKTYTARKQTREVVVTGPAAEIVPEITAMTSLTGSAVPIIDGRELLKTALSTTEGGLYYSFRGLEVGKTKLKDYLLSRGASEEQVARLESLEKAVVLSSAVTGKERMVAVFQGAGVRPSTGSGICSLTFDPFDEDRAAGDSPVRNLLDFRGRAIEGILELANGFHEWTLFDAVTGLLVASAPDQAAADHLIPAPYSKILQPGISCIRCHARGDGWQGLENDVPKILAGGTDIFGDLSSPADQQKQVQLLAGLYSGDWFTVGTGPLSVGRLTYDRACFEVTGKPVAEISNLIATLYAGYAYELLDVWDVANELGVVGLPPSDNDPETSADVKAACEVLNQFIAAVPVPGQITREDGVIAAIKAGIPVSRRSWQSAAHIARERTMTRGLK